MARKKRGKGFKKGLVLGLPWWSSGWDFKLPMWEAWIQSLVRELDPTCGNYDATKPNK